MAKQIPRRQSYRFFGCHNITEMRDGDRDVKIGLTKILAIAGADQAVPTQ
jgi:hypothetical protein